MFYLNFFVTVNALRPSQQFFSNIGKFFLVEPELGSECFVQGHNKVHLVRLKLMTSLSVSRVTH